MGDQSQIQLHHHKRHHVHGRTLTPPKQQKIARKTRILGIGESTKYSKPNSRNQLEHTNEHQPHQENKNPKYSMPSNSRMAKHQHRETKGKILPHNIVRNTRDRKTSNHNITPIAYTQCKTPSTPKRKICTQNTIL